MRIASGPVVIVVAASGLAAQAPQPVARHDVAAIVRALDAAGVRAGWPGFEPTGWPVAVFDGGQTLLVRHPAPPAEFIRDPARPDALVMPGRHPAVVANSTREIGGTRTATVNAPPEESIDRVLLATVEEVFHVFWLARHPDFRPNEMARYAYPTGDLDNLDRLLGEDEALARALDAATGDEAAGWSAVALALRRQRVARLDDATRAYETALENMEGTANYVARRGLDELPARTAARLRAPRAADDVRWRFYDSGAALCFVLDRLAAGWKVEAEEAPARTLAAMLGAALERRAVPVVAFTAADEDARRTRAAQMRDALAERQRRVRDDVAAWQGTRIAVRVADGDPPLEVRRFDPLQLLVLGDGDVAHARNLVLGRGSAVVEVTNPAFVRGTFAGTVAMTQAAGAHPLSGGVRMVLIAGITVAPAIDATDGRVVVVAPGVRIDVPGSQVRSAGPLVEIVVRTDPR